MVYCYSRAISIVILLALLLVPASVVYAAEQEVNMPASGWDYLGGPNVTIPGFNPWCKLGQRLTIHGTVTRIGYRVCRVGTPTGNVTFSIYDAETDDVIFTKVWGDASELPTTNSSGYQYVEVNPPLVLNQEVRLCVEYCAGNSLNYCMAGYYSGDRITGEYYTNCLLNGNWHDIEEAEEGSYHYTYIPPDDPPLATNDGGLPDWALIAFGFIGATLATLLCVYVKKRKKA